MDKNTCSLCGKPVYFAERKTSLGRDWHPNCLRCLQCNKILTPGQHAERKGMPYCHKPCYGALFGPQMFGYGSNVTSPANFRKSGDPSIESHDSSFDDDKSDRLKCVFKSMNTSPGPLKPLTNNNNNNNNAESPSKLSHKRNSASVLDSSSSSSGYSSNSSTGNSVDLKSVVDSTNDSGLKCVYQSNASKQPAKKTEPVKLVPLNPAKLSVYWNILYLWNYVNMLALFLVISYYVLVSRFRKRGAELFKRVQSYNDHHQNKRGQTLSFIENDGNVGISGPLRIYWGLKKPIILKQYDEVPTIPLPKKRYSVITDNRDLKPLPEMDSSKDSPSSQLKTRGHVGVDDSILSSPSSDVVMRRTNIKKSNTVAYRGDKPNRWKRASINGHIYNYDLDSDDDDDSYALTSVFTPVLGSCTSVTVDNKMTVLQVIKTLLEKFKVENEAEEYNLCIITEQEGERLLKDSDIPLLERLMLGPTDSVKIFIRDHTESSPVANPAHIPDGSSPTMETPPQETPLPEEVEQLMNIPEPVLRGLLDKFQQDEEQAVRRLKAKYERIRRRVQQIIEDKKSNSTRC